jgi:hypothetical protein
MVTDMTEDCQGLSVQAVNFAHRSGPVFYASLPCFPASAETLKHRLVASLWDHLAVAESSASKRYQFFNRAALPIEVVRGLLGRPRLLVGKYQGPSISFSESKGTVWAALCADDSEIGIDVATPGEFQGEYPFHRVFHPEELQHALSLADGNLEGASALLWSVKEAVVKALGSAFHLVDPLQVTVYPTGESTASADNGYTFVAGLSGKALKGLERFSLASGYLSVHALPLKKAWLSIAVMNQRPAGHEWDQ